MHAAATAAAKSLQSCRTLCDPIDCSPPGSPVPGILQARTLEWVAISFSKAWKWKVKVKSLSCIRLSNPMDYCAPGSSVYGILQARILEWIAMPSFKGFFLTPGLNSHLSVSCTGRRVLYHWRHLRSPLNHRAAREVPWAILSYNGLPPHSLLLL